MFPVYSGKIPFKVPGNIPNVPGILNIGIFPDCSMNILLMLIEKKDKKKLGASQNKKITSWDSLNMNLRIFSLVW